MAVSFSIFFVFHYALLRTHMCEEKMTFLGKYDLTIKVSERGIMGLGAMMTNHIPTLLTLYFASFFSVALSFYRAVIGQML